MNRTSLLSLLFLACSPAAQAQESPQALQDAFLAALRAHDTAALAACYTADAVYFPVDAMQKTGPDAVRASWEDFFGRYRLLEVTVSDDHMETRGDTAVSWGLFQMTVEPLEGGDSMTMKGRFMDVARDVDGQWLYVADHASLPLPAAEPANEK